MPGVQRDDEAFDRWMRLSLKASHADVLKEPIPEALLALLRTDPDGR